MGFKARGYNKDKAQEKARDYSLFVIACEGTEREPEYLRPFDGIDRIKVDIIENNPGDRSTSPLGVLDKAKNYIQEIGLSEKDNDSIWFVIDVDKWPKEQMIQIRNTFFPI